MKRETTFRKIPDKKLSDDDFPEELLRNVKNLASDEFTSELDKELLSGHDLIDMDGEWEESYICLDRFLASQMIPYYK